MRGYRQDDDPEYDKLNRILSEHQRRLGDKLDYDGLVELPYKCSRCQCKAVDRRTFRNLVWETEYRFPRRCEKCRAHASAKKPKMADVCSEDLDARLAFAQLVNEARDRRRQRDP